MAVKIRLTRTGRKKKPSYRVVVMDSRKPRDGAYIEQIGRYEPLAEPSIVEIDNERNIVGQHQRIGSHTITEGYAELPF